MTEEQTNIEVNKPAEPVTNQPPARPTHRRTRPLTALLCGIIILALGFGGGWLGAASHGDSSTNITQQKTVLSDQAAVVSSIAKSVGSAVVSVNVTSQSQSASPYSGLFGGQTGAQTQESAGTGMILTTDGLIMTNRHVVPSGTTSVSVTLSDGTVFDNVKVVGRTSDSDSLDVAFLKIQDTKGKTLSTVKIGDSSTVKVGDSVVAIGNALGQFQNTVTSGIISGYGRSVTAGDSSGTSTENLDDLFQTDAAINEGNSGGPLVDLNGEVIGMNTAIAADSQNIGFAIPINDLSGLINSVKSSGTLQRPYLGVRFVPLTSDVAKEYDLSVDRGAYIPKASDLGQNSIISGGPADQAGLQEGDIITKVDGTNVDQTTSLTSLLNKHKVGDKITLTIIRDGKTITKDVTLGTAPHQLVIAYRSHDAIVHSYDQRAVVPPKARNGCYKYAYGQGFVDTYSNRYDAFHSYDSKLDATVVHPDTVNFSSIAGVIFQQQSQYAGRYIDGFLDTHQYPNLGQGLRYVGNSTDYHRIGVHYEDVPMLRIRIVAYRAAYLHELHDGAQNVKRRATPQEIGWGIMHLAGQPLSWHIQD